VDPSSGSRSRPVRSSLPEPAALLRQWRDLPSFCSGTDHLSISSLLLAAASGDVPRLQQFVCVSNFGCFRVSQPAQTSACADLAPTAVPRRSGINVNSVDYDKRSPLHVAARCGSRASPCPELSPSAQRGQAGCREVPHRGRRAHQRAGPPRQLAPRRRSACLSMSLCCTRAVITQRGAGDMLPCAQPCTTRTMRSLSSCAPRAAT
jgi:hypothetical protein